MYSMALHLIHHHPLTPPNVSNDFILVISSKILMYLYLLYCIRDGIAYAFWGGFHVCI
jgi:hypothetical protein